MPRVKRLSHEQRHAQILAMLARERTVRVATLAQLFAVTTETARRDLDELARVGAVERTYGGAASRSLTGEPAVGERARRFAAQRARIGAAAAALVHAGDTLLIDSGSTTSHFARALAARDVAVTALTNCLMVAQALAASPRCRVILAPGDLVLREGGVYGSDTAQYIGRFRARRAVIGASGVAESGVMDADSASCAVKRAMMACAERTTLLVDSTKFGTPEFERVCALTDIDEVVCEAAPPKSLATALRRAKVKVLVARQS
jgi:DeoR/GlpR family transcriptional regulator of sugar metabolism